MSEPTAVVDRTDPAAERPARRVAGLDGLRGLCALYVLLYHCWAYTFTGHGRGSGPIWLAPLGFGRLAVVFFLVLSGFSLALSAAGRGWQLGGVARFARRRAWRILPPYWAALLFSLVIAAVVVPQPHAGPPDGRSVLVFGLLAQDLVPAATPNGAFWSISVEALLYLAFPLAVGLCRRAGVAAMLAVATVPVVAVVVAAGADPPDDRWLAPQLLPVFAAGIAAAGIVVASDRVRRWPWAGAAAVALVPVVGLVLSRGADWTVTHYFWVDLAITPALALTVVAVAAGRPAVLVRWLSLGPLVRLGRSSYSLYLIHLPIVVAVREVVVAPRLGDGVAAFTATALGAGGLALTAAPLFAKVFEFPFQRHRSWPELIRGRNRTLPLPMPGTRRRPGS